MDTILFKKESYQIIGACMEVHKILGPGFLESVYQEALEREFIIRNIPYEREKELQIYYKGIPLKKKFNADFFCFDMITVELKAVILLTDEFRAQVINYLKATKQELGLLVNFGEPSLNFDRLVRYKSYGS